MSLGQGNIIRQQKKEAAAPPTVTAANNGLSLSGTTVQLGATAIGSNSPLLHNSFINTGATLFLEIITTGLVALAVASSIYLLTLRRRYNKRMRELDNTFEKYKKDIEDLKQDFDPRN